RAERARLRGVPEDGFDLGPSPALPDVRARRLLRQLAEPSRHPPLPRHAPPDHRGVRPARGLGMVLPRRGDARPRRRRAAPEGPDPALRLNEKIRTWTTVTSSREPA